MIRDDIWAFTVMAVFAALLLFAAAALADEPKLPAGYSCEDVRAKVAELGRVKALALALESGATWKQIREARKCLR
jgi:hypothetical protein